jgi:uncharacterized membrane protein YdfJ with MMPL/SSD domain
MTSVFASFILSPDPTTKSLGFSLALGVLIDAFVIRMTVVPATMYIFKGAARWLPHWMQRAGMFPIRRATNSPPARRCPDGLFRSTCAPSS